MTLITFCLSSKPNNNLRQTKNQFKKYILKLLFKTDVQLELPFKL